MSLFHREYIDGKDNATLADALAYDREYWQGRTTGMRDEEIMAYLAEGNAERGKAHLIDPYPTSADTLH